MPIPAPASPLTAWTPVPILMYHAVETDPRPPDEKHFYVLASEFAWQMHALRRAHYTPLTFGQLAQAMDGTLPLPARPILLTFDDGYRNFRTNAWPLLRALGFASTVFLVSDQVGGVNAWDVAQGYAPQPLLDWAEIRELQDGGGVDFQAHTVTHPYLTQFTPKDVRRELTESKDVLEQRLQKAVDVLCYPYGDVDERVALATRESGYHMAVTTRTGRVRAQDDRLWLPRLSVYHVPPLSLRYGVGTLNFWWRVKRWADTRPLP